MLSGMNSAWECVMFLIGLCVAVGLVMILLVLFTGLIVLLIGLLGLIKNAWRDSM